MADNKHPAIEHHKTAAEQHRRAAEHHDKAAQLHKSGKHEQAGDQANQAHGHASRANEQANQAARKTSEHNDLNEHQHTMEADQEHMHQTGVTESETAKDPNAAYELEATNSVQRGHRSETTAK